MFWGTANPTGENGSYDGLYLRRDEISRMVLDRELLNLPVKVEHGGDAVGHVISAWQHKGRLDILIELDGAKCNAEAAVAKEFIRNAVCRELSLGYTVDMSHSANLGVSAGKKKLSEVSIVRNGARDDCLIRACTASSTRPFKK